MSSSIDLVIQATDIHSEFMKAIDACHVKYQEDKVDSSAVSCMS